MSLRSLSLCILVLLPASIALAQPAPMAAPPATAPATTQASIPTDQTSPRGALKVLTVAMNKGDADSIKSVFAPANPLETKMVDAVVNQQQAMMKFHAAAVTAFGADEAKKLPPGDIDAAVTESLAALDKFPESVTGDTATVGEGDQLLHLKKQGDKWILPVSMLAPQITPDNVDQQLGQMTQQSQVLIDITDDMGKGKFKTADDAGKALQLKVMQQMMGHAATEPATAPSAPPAPQAPPGL
jgi:hypothetical protein